MAGLASHLARHLGEQGAQRIKDRRLTRTVDPDEHSDVRLEGEFEPAKTSKILENELPNLHSHAQCTPPLDRVEVGSMPIQERGQLRSDGLPTEQRRREARARKRAPSPSTA